jgi:hypothetical protein
MKIKLNGDVLLEFESAKRQLKENKMKECLRALREATPVDTGNARDGWRIEGASLTNDVEYIDLLNKGTSKQAPSHFIEKTLLSQGGIIPNGTIVS